MVQPGLLSSGRFEMIKMTFEKIYSFIEKDDSSPLIALILFSLILKVVLVGNVEIINPDGIRYINSALQLFQGNFSEAFTHEKMLFYTFTLGLFHFMMRDWLLAGQILSLACLIMTTVPLYFLSCDLFGKRTAFWACLAFSVLPFINELSSKVIKDPPFILFFMLAAWTGSRSLSEKKPIYFILTPLFTILAALYRIEGVVFALVFFLILAGYIFLKEQERPAFLKGITIYATFLMIFLGFLIAFMVSGIFQETVYNTVYVRFKETYFRLGQLETYRLIYDHLKTVEHNFPGGQWTQDFFEISRHNLYLIYFIGLVETFLKALFPVYIIPLMFSLNVRKNLNRGSVYLLLVFVCYLLVGYLFLITMNFLSKRYLLVPAMLALPFVGYGCEHLVEKMKRLKFSKIAIIVSLGLFLCVPVYKSIDNTLGEKVEIKLAGEWLRSNNAMVSTSIITTDERVPFYAGLMRGQYDIFFENNVRDLESTALRKNRDLIIWTKSLKYMKYKPDFDNFSLVILIYRRNS
jgi:4-amino-4-deoxy-L-arabinose transferase-like glycosyltransferase